MVDIAHHIVAREELGLPSTYRQAIELLAEAEIVERDLADRLGRMVSFRNRIVHLYEEIDPGRVFDILEHHLGDLRSFQQAVIRRYL